MKATEQLFCGECGSEAGPCENGTGPAHEPVTAHDHEYSEWWCTGCWEEIGGGAAGWVEKKEEGE